MYQAIIIADDFSSVTDCGVQFTMHGLATLALMCSPEHLPQGDVLSVDTDSRALPLVQAYDAVYQTAVSLRASGCRKIYKSVDSTLRGNLGAEIDAVMDAMELPVALVAPAFPHYGRTIVDGIHRLNGIPLAQSSLANDPVSPMQDSELVSILHRQTRRSIGRISLSEVRAGEEPLYAAVMKLIENGVALVTFDTETEEDLRRISCLAAKLPEALIVGSTGLAQYIAEGWHIAKKRTEARKLCQTAPLLFVAASASPVTAEQIERLLCCENICPIQMTPWEVAVTQKEDKFEKAKQALENGRDVVLYIDSTSSSRSQSLQKAEKHGVSPEELSKRIVQGMATITSKLVNTRLPGGLIMTGGDTAKTICTALECDGMELAGEIETGIPYGRLSGKQRLLVATKAGAFGMPDALRVARRIMRKI